MAGQKRRGLLRSQARMTHVYEEVGEETLMLCLPTFTVPPNPPCYPCHGQQSSCCLGVTGCHPSTEICSCTFGREGCLFIPHHRHSGSSLVQDTGDTQSAPTVTQIPTDLHPVAVSLPTSLSLHTGSRLKGREAIPGDRRPASLLTGKLGIRLFTLYSATVLLLGRPNSGNANIQHKVPLFIHHLKNPFCSPIRKVLSLVHR